ncbi:hypothetical protein [Thalassoglobus neptunius]|uniref:hypothetical protein n=1 Tax=Thalassoglobus neptunius TaxID=1938619 RepID=UPI0011B760EB|nr:hypothetical protein [Thalassoglobus neptunius]
MLLWNEIPVWLNEESQQERFAGWLSGREPDWLPFLPFLILFPLCFLGGGGFLNRASSGSKSEEWSESPRDEKPRLVMAWGLSLVVGSVAFLMAHWTSHEFDGLPPAYHDEYSYLLQAETFLNGKWSYPSFKEYPELFNQMHVLNEGEFASRYFPGTGAWISLGMLVSNEWFAHLLAQTFAAIMIFWTGRELANSGTGLLAGLLFALSPGMILFSNLLLAHHPTLVGLTIFLWAFVRMIRTDCLTMSWVAGIGLAYSMICRPMTAAGFGLPFGVLFVWWWIRGSWGIENPEKPLSFRQRSFRTIGLAIPLIIGFAVVMVQNKQITGDLCTSPYQLYTDIYTPRHVYGFNNVVRGEQALGPKVLENYDQWAENLTPQLALKNGFIRIENSWRWTLGIIPILASVIIFLLTMRSDDRRWWLIFLAIVSLHVAHIPYWFSGIFGWHYVFETGPLWILIVAETTRRLWSDRAMSSQRLVCVCWMLFLGTSVLVNLVTIKPVWPATLDRGVAEVRYPRTLYSEFREQIEDLRDQSPAIVFVIPDLSDRSMDYVTNPPSLDGPVLVARISDPDEVESLAALFPGRVPILFDAHTRSFEMLEKGRSQ